MSCDTLCSSMHAAPDTGLASYQQLLQWTSQSTVTQAATWPARSNHINPLASALQCHIISFCNLIPFLTSCMGSSQTPIVSEQSGSMTILKPLTCIWQLSSVPKHTLKSFRFSLLSWCPFLWARQCFRESQSLKTECCQPIGWCTIQQLDRVEAHVDATTWKNFEQKKAVHNMQLLTWCACWQGLYIAGLAFKQTISFQMFVLLFKNDEHSKSDAHGSWMWKSEQLWPRTLCECRIENQRHNCEPLVPAFVFTAADSCTCTTKLLTKHVLCDDCCTQNELFCCASVCWHNMIASRFATLTL